MSPETVNGKHVSESYSELSELALPNDANGLGNLLGGKLMHLVDIAGAIAAARHSGEFVVTASFDHMDFLEPVGIGELVVLHAGVNRARATCYGPSKRISSRSSKDLMRDAVSHLPLLKALQSRDAEAVREGLHACTPRRAPMYFASARPSRRKKPDPLIHVEVVVEFPLADTAVILAPLFPLDADIVVGVGLAQSPFDDFVLLEAVESFA